MILTLEEVEADKRFSQIDLEALEKVVYGMRQFIHCPCGESRHYLKPDLLKWDSLLAQCNQLHERILQKHKELCPP